MAVLAGAVLNHNSDFAIVPEPSTWALLAVGGLAVAVLGENFPASMNFKSTSKS